MAPPSISEEFNRFSGLSVNIIETTRDTSRGSFVVPQLVGPDPVVEDLKHSAHQAGLRLRLWLPGMMSTMDVKGDRLNAYVEKAADGIYRIQPRFRIG
ncbi:MAG: hypothetical protein ACOYK8_04830 [Alphaproteobacteria bacterium]